jgi:asparagine N-glycosylation enzyme membrane subunit Stt3
MSSPEHHARLIPLTSWILWGIAIGLPVGIFALWLTSETFRVSQPPSWFRFIWFVLPVLCMIAAWLVRVSFWRRLFIAIVTASVCVIIILAIGMLVATAIGLAF